MGQSRSRFGIFSVFIRTGTSSLGKTEFERLLDHSIIKIRAQTEVSRKEVKQAITVVLAEMELSESQYVFDGKDELAKLHTLRFRGAGGLAGNRAKKLLMLQNTASGWRKLHANDEKGAKWELYLDGDKNRKMVKAEVLAKKLAAAISPHLPGGKRTCVKRSAGVVSVDFVPLARIIIKNEHAFTIDWNAIHPVKSIPKEAIEKEIRSATEASEGTAWG
jgi:hypothetical protein